jgi:hypothetical protein
MSEVQNIGAVDSVQYQPSQYSNEELADVYNTQPEVYDEHMAEMRAASKSRLGASLLSAAIRCKRLVKPKGYCKSLLKYL